MQVPKHMRHCTSIKVHETLKLQTRKLYTFALQSGQNVENLSRSLGLKSYFEKYKSSPAFEPPIYCRSLLYTQIMIVEE